MSLSLPAIRSDATIRFCGKWRHLFHSQAHPLLRLRLITPYQLRLDSTDPLIRNSARQQALEELKAWDVREPDLRLYERTHVEWHELNEKPELSALIIGHRLFSWGHHPHYLHELTKYWMYILSRLAAPDGGLSQIYSDSGFQKAFDDTGFSFSKWESANPRHRASVYFFLKRGRAPSLIFPPETGISRLRLRDLPASVVEAISAEPAAMTDVTSESAVPNSIAPESMRFVLRVDVDSVDYVSAIDDAFEELNSASRAVRRLISSRRGGGRRPSLDPYSGLLEYAVVESAQDSAVKAKRWADRLHNENVSVGTGYELKHGLELIGASPSFEAIVRIYDDAMLATRVADSEAVYRILAVGLDNILTAVACFGRGSKNIEHHEIPAIGAKVLAMDSLRRAYVYLGRIYCTSAMDKYRRNEAEAVLTDIDQLVVGRLGVGLEFLLEKNIYTSSAYDVGWFLDRRFASLSRSMQAAATRYYFDLNRVILCRHELVHRGRDKTNEYLANVLLLLFRTVMEFRLALVPHLDRVKILHPLCKTHDDAFAVAVRLMLVDFDNIVEGTTPFGIVRDTGDVVRWGWGCWSAKLEQVLSRMTPVSVQGHLETKGWKDFVRFEPQVFDLIM